ncbi:MAG: hypothetical protein KGZ74_20050 [Chitinophagaceae bacterium]|nr:hypothetical protein [Chitinophagaceae bacterium]
MEEKPYHSKEERPHIVSEAFVPYEKQEEHETEMRRRAIMMSDMEKFKLFCKMMRIAKMLSSAKITHKHIEE